MLQRSLKKSGQKLLVSEILQKILQGHERRWQNFYSGVVFKLYLDTPLLFLLFHLPISTTDFSLYITMFQIIGSSSLILSLLSFFYIWQHTYTVLSFLYPHVTSLLSSTNSDPLYLFFLGIFFITNLYPSSLQLPLRFTSNLAIGRCYDSPRNLALILFANSYHISLRMLEKVLCHFPIEWFWKSLYNFLYGTFESMFLFPFKTFLIITKCRMENSYTVFFKVLSDACF